MVLRHDFERALGELHRVERGGDLQQQRLVEVMRLGEILLEEPPLHRGQGRSPGDRPLLRLDGLRLTHLGRQLRDGRVLEQLLGRQSKPCLVSPGDQLDAQDRVAAYREEVVVHAHARNTQNLLPKRRQRLLHSRPRRHVRAIVVCMPPFQSRQRLAVDLAVGRQRQRFELHERRRHHVRRQCLLQLLAQRRGDRGAARCSHHVRHQPLGACDILTRQHHRLVHLGQGAQRGLDLAQLDPEATDLHLMVDASRGSPARRPRASAPGSPVR